MKYHEINDDELYERVKQKKGSFAEICDGAGAYRIARMLVQKDVHPLLDFEKGYNEEFLQKLRLMQNDVFCYFNAEVGNTELYKVIVKCIQLQKPQIRATLGDVAKVIMFERLHGVARRILRSARQRGEIIQEEHQVLFKNLIQENKRRSTAGFLITSMACDDFMDSSGNIKPLVKPVFDAQLGRVKNELLKEQTYIKQCVDVIFDQRYSAARALVNIFQKAGWDEEIYIVCDKLKVAKEYCRNPEAFMVTEDIGETLDYALVEKALPSIINKEVIGDILHRVEDLVTDVNGIEEIRVFSTFYSYNITALQCDIMFVICNEGCGLLEDKFSDCSYHVGGYSTIKLTRVEYDNLNELFMNKITERSFRVWKQERVLP